MKNNVRAMVEGAVTAAIFILFLLIVVYTPIGAIFFLILPLPFIIYATRHSWQKSIAAGVAALLLTIPLGLILLFPIMVFAWAVGSVMGYSFARKHSALQTIVLGSLATLGYVLLALLITTLFLNMNIINEMSNLIRTMFDESQGILQALLPNNELSPTNDLVDLLIQEIQLRFPYLLIMNAIMMGLINYWIGYGVNKRMGFVPTPFPQIKTLRFPRSLLYYYLGTLVVSLIPGLQDVEWVYISIINIQPILQMAMAIQGLLFVFFYTMEKGMGKGIRILTAVLLFIQPFTYILMIIGILDLGLNLRKKLTSRS